MNEATWDRGVCSQATSCRREITKEQTKARCALATKVIAKNMISFDLIFVLIQPNENAVIAEM